MGNLEARVLLFAFQLWILPWGPYSLSLKKWNYVHHIQVYDFPSLELSWTWISEIAPGLLLHSFHYRRQLKTMTEFLGKKVDPSLRGYSGKFAESLNKSASRVPSPTLRSKQGNFKPDQVDHTLLQSSSENIQWLLFSFLPAFPSCFVWIWQFLGNFSLIQCKLEERVVRRFL